MRHALLAAVFVAATASPVLGQSPHEPSPPLTAPDWMAGYWLSCADGRQVSETWTGAGSGALFGVGLTRAARGVMEFEFVRIAPHEGGYAYFAQPGGRAPVAFKLVISRPDRVVFENPAHDFPQRVTYERSGETLTARIETADGRNAMSWRYTRAPLDQGCPAG
jgi:hypothetical protein